MKKSLILGFFDGVHRAHQAVIISADKFGGEKVLITLRNFHKTADCIFSRQNSFEKMKSLGVKEIIELDFTKFSAMPASDFIKYLVENFSPISISTGYNYTFGHNKEGNSVLLKAEQGKYGYIYICTPPQSYDGEIVSSSLIKNCLKKGDVERANLMLGSNFLLEGTVIRGAQIGRTIGFPTANIKYPQNIIQIPFGVYMAKVGKNTGLLNWGIKPTVHNTKEPVAEVHIIDFQGDLYGKKIKIEIIKKIRDEQKFASLEELKLQINKDIEECLK